jgi:hypothetical protein
MAIYLEFIDFVVPISTIQKKYRGGWEQCLRDHARLIGGRVWYDEYLFRDGAMNRHDIKLIVDRWTEIGFEPKEFRDGKQVWKDVCVVESLLGGAYSALRLARFRQQSAYCLPQGDET